MGAQPACSGTWWVGETLTWLWTTRPSHHCPWADVGEPATALPAALLPPPHPRASCAVSAVPGSHSPGQSGLTLWQAWGPSVTVEHEGDHSPAALQAPGFSGTRCDICDLHSDAATPACCSWRRSPSCVCSDLSGSTGCPVCFLSGGWRVSGNRPRAARPSCSLASGSSRSLGLLPGGWADSRGP